jgi:superfamily I DNA/RNA helicase
MTEEEYQQARNTDTQKILSSEHKKRVILAGPGTGKSYLLAEAIKVKKKQGKTKFHAITFIGKLGDALADDLAGLSRVTTMHSFAREFVLDHRPKGWVYSPFIHKIITDDLQAMGKSNIKVGDSEYEERTNYYKAVGNDDVVYYAVKLLKESGDNYPDLDMLLVDEFQDFNEIEDELISLLAEKVDVLIVGDDDQALYGWKNASPKYIRDKHSDANEDYESHTLRWCTRCTEPVIGAFHDIVEDHADTLKGRTSKDYLYFLPEKEKDSLLNPKLIVMRAPHTSIAQSITRELSALVQTQKIKSVLVIGDAKSCKYTLPTVAKVLRQMGFNSVDYKENSKPLQLDHDLFEGYKYLSQEEGSPLGWRLVAKSLPDKDLDTLIPKSFSDSKGLIGYLEEEFKKRHLANAAVFKKVVSGTPSARKAIADTSMEKLYAEIVKKKKSDRELLVEQIIDESHFLHAPLSNLDITVCSISGSKGLGADVVFVIGFDQGKFPAAVAPKDDEIYHMLVALTRTKKRFYMVNTMGVPISNFIKSIKPERYETRQNTRQS